VQNWGQSLKENWNLGSVNTIHIPVKKRIEMCLGWYASELERPLNIKRVFKRFLNIWSNMSQPMGFDVQAFLIR
jgi:hypothetical protein